MTERIATFDAVSELALTCHNARQNVSDLSNSPVHFFYEFFAGGGMARAGLGQNWQCLYANDFDLKKSETYRANWGEGVLQTKDVRKVKLSELPQIPHLVWASFPCQDLSLAGMGAGLKGDRSGTFWPFWEIMKSLESDDRGPRVIVLENVCGTLTSHEGKDFKAIADALAGAGYRYGAVVVDAADFVPQSRPRLFIIAVAKDVPLPVELVAREASANWHSKALQRAQMQLKGSAKAKWIWWNLPKPERRSTRFADLVEEHPEGVSWHSPAETAKLIAMMSDLNKEKLNTAKRSGQFLVGTIYKRTRPGNDQAKVQRAEVRFDNIAGCLRTSSGGSSRQLVVVLEGDEVRTRLLSIREAARLMGLPEDYVLPQRYNEAYHLIGDGVVVPVVRFLAQTILEPILANHHLKGCFADDSSDPLPAKY